MTWRNWAGTESATPCEVLVPRSAEELAAAVARWTKQGKRVKAVGAGHSFTGAAVASQVQVRLDRLSAVTALERGR